MVFWYCDLECQFLRVSLCLFFAVSPFGWGESMPVGAVHSLLAFGWLIATVKTPKFIKRLTDDSTPGVGGVVGGVARTGTTIFNLVRAIR